MTDRRRRLVLWVVLVAVSSACMAVFPAFDHFIGGIRWELGLITGFGLRDAWVKSRRP
jgi:hypothetical protein